MEEADARYYAYKNLLVVSFTFLFLFTAYLPLQDLQTSLYSANGLGFVNLFALYTSTALCSLFIPNVLLTCVGHKTAMILSIICGVVYIVSNLYPTWWTLIPSSIICGLGIGTLWPVATSYIKHLAMGYAEATNEAVDTVFSKFYPIFFSIYKLSQIFGNLISSSILKIPRKGNFNLTGVTCGSAICPDTNLTVQHIHVIYAKILLLVVVCIGSCCISIVLLITCLDRNKNSVSKKESVKCNSIISPLKEFRDIRMVLLTPIVLLSGMQCGFIYADFTKAFVTCYVGADMIGYTMAVFGTFSFLSALSYSMIGKYTGPFVILVVTGVVEIVFMLVLLKWRGTYCITPYLFVAAAVGGICDSAWRSQIPVLAKHIFSSKYNEIFSLVTFLMFSGFATQFGSGTYLCVHTRIFIIIGFVSVGMMLVCIVEYWHFKEIKEVGEYRKLKAAE